MNKFSIILVALVFLVGAGAGALVIISMNGKEPSSEIHSAANDKKSQEENKSENSENTSEEGNDDNKENKNEEGRSEEEEDKKADTEFQETDELDGNYGDVSSCSELANAQAYAKGNDDSYMYMLPGKNDWIYRTKQDFKMSFDISDEDIVLYKKLVDRLKIKGTELVIAYIPPRGMVAAENIIENSALMDDYDPAIARQNYEAFIKKMNDAGIHFVGTHAPSVGAKYFNHADQHWTTQGAKAMAEAVATFVRGMPIASQFPKQEFKTVVGTEVKYDGRFGKFINKVCGFRPNPEIDVQVKTEKVGEVGEQALLGDAVVPEVVLVGTSNSIRDEFNSNFDGSLKEALSTDVYNAAISGGGMDDSLLAYLTSENFAKHPPKLLIWELPGYYDVSGEGMEYALRQALATASGYCDEPLVEFPKTLLSGKKVTLFENLQDKNIGAEQSYIAIRFDETVSKDFSISIKTTDKDNEKFKFKKRREGNSNSFFYMPKGDDKLLVSVALNINNSIEGLNAEARICPLTTVQTP